MLEEYCTSKERNNDEWIIPQIFCLIDIFLISKSNVRCQLSIYIINYKLKFACKAVGWIECIYIEVFYFKFQSLTGHCHKTKMAVFKFTTSFTVS